VFCETDLAVSRGASYKGKKMSGDKRPIPEDDGNRDEDLPELKKPRKSLLPSFLIEALKVEGFHKLWPMLEPLFRKVVGEEVERALKNFTPKVAPW
jgi:hypothetical protein